MESFISVWTIVVSMVVSVVLGFFWYGPLFGKAWMKLSGIQMPEKKPSASVMVKPIILSLIGSFFMTYVLSFSIAFHNAYYHTSGSGAAVAIGFLLWLGFIVPTHFNFTGWEGKPWKLFFIHTGYWLVFIVIVSNLIA